MESKNKHLPLSWPLPRSEVEEMNAYTAPLEGRRKLLRLDFNENTIGPSPLVLKALRNIPRNHISIYPEYNGLKEAVIKNLNAEGITIPLKPNQIGIFNGVDAAIHAIFHSYGNRDDQILTTTPTFGYYAPCAQMQGMDILAIPYEGKNFAFPLTNIRKALIEQKPRLLLICNPNNPTGTKLSAEKILGLATEASDTLIVVDELYEAFSGESVLPRVDFNSTSNLLVLRSLSKTAGLAGLRIGFAIGNTEVVSRVSRVSGPYDVNSFAVTAAFAALQDQKYINDYVSEVFRARDWIKEKLLISNTKHHLDGGNYLLIWPKRDPSEIESSLRSEGILVRNMSGKPLIDKALRVSIGTKAQMQQFWEAFIKHEGMSIHN